MRKSPVYLDGAVWWCRVRNPSGGRHLRFSTKCKDRTAAVAVWRELERRVLSGAHSPTDQALGDALDDRLAERRAHGRAAGTLRMLAVKGRHLARVLGADLPLSRLTAELVDRYIETRLSEGAKRATIHKELSTLRGALRLALRRGRFSRPIESVMPHGFSPAYKPRTRALSLAEIDSLLEVLEPHRRAVVAIILGTGATYPSEVVGMRRADVGADFVLLRGTKRETRWRKVPVLDMTRAWLDLARPHVPFATWSNIRRDLHLACARAGIAPCCPTDLRRSVGTLLRARGVEPSLIGAYLGHGDSRMAERVYGRIAPEALRELIERRAGHG